MKQKLLLLVVYLCMNTFVQAQDLVIHVDKKGRVGFVDKNGTEVIKCQYESAIPFKDGLSIVMKGKKYGMIDTSGTIVLPIKYDQISSWNDNLHIVKSGKKAGLVDKSGKIVLKPNYSLITKPNCYGKALIATGGKATQNNKKTYMMNAKYGIIDKNGNILVQPIYKGLYEYSYDGERSVTYSEGKRLAYSYHYISDTLITDCNYLGFSSNGNNVYDCGVIDSGGNVLIKSGLYSFVMMPQDGMSRYYNIKKKETLCGFHNLENGTSFQTNKIASNINDIKTWTHGDFYGSIAPVHSDTWSFYGKDGMSLRNGYKDIRHGNTVGLWAACKADGKWDVFDENNNDVASLSGLDDIYFPTNDGDKEIFTVKKNGYYGVVNRDGSEVIPFEYELALGNSYDIIVVKKNGKWGAVNTENELVVPMDFIDIKLLSERNQQHFWVQKTDSMFYHYNYSQKSLSDKGYKNAGNFKKGFAFVIPADLKVEDSSINRAMLFMPNAKHATLSAADFKKLSKDTFFYIINEDDAVVFDEPVTALYIEDVKEAIIKNGGKALTDTEKKNILLEVTKTNRSYAIGSTISETEWNY